jgi:hypothetical protein
MKRMVNVLFAGVLAMTVLSCGEEKKGYTLNEVKEMLIKVVLEENPHLKANEVEVHLIKNWKFI